MRRAPGHWVDLDAPRRVSPPPRGWLKTVAAIAEVVFTTDAGPPPPERIAWLCEEVRDFFEGASVNARAVFRLSLVAVTSAAPLLAMRPVPLSRLDLKRRALALERLERTPLGAALFAVKAILCIIYYEHPDAAAEIGFDGAPLREDS